jgi:uncharacterized membrane protein
VQLGAVELLVIGFPENHFSGEIAPALADLVGKGTIRLIDVVFVARHDDGSVIGLELSSVDEATREAFAPLLIDGESLIHDDDIADVADALDPGSSVALVLFEHTWANGFRRALVDAGGELIDSFRVAPETIDASRAASDLGGA